MASPPPSPPDLGLFLAALGHYIVTRAFGVLDEVSLIIHATPKPMLLLVAALTIALSYAAARGQRTRAAGGSRRRGRGVAGVAEAAGGAGPTATPHELRSFHARAASPPPRPPVPPEGSQQPPLSPAAADAAASILSAAIQSALFPGSQDTRGRHGSQHRRNNERSQSRGHASPSPERRNGRRGGGRGNGGRDNGGRDRRRNSS